MALCWRTPPPSRSVAAATFPLWLVGVCVLFARFGYVRSLVVSFFFRVFEGGSSGDASLCGWFRSDDISASRQQVQHPRRQEQVTQGGRLPGQGAKLSRSCHFEGNGSSWNQGRFVTSRDWGDGAEEIENNEDMEKFYKPSWASQAWTWLGDKWMHLFSLFFLGERVFRMQTELVGCMRCPSHLSLGGLQQIRRLQSGRAHRPRVAWPVADMAQEKRG